MARVVTTVSYLRGEGAGGLHRRSTTRRSPTQQGVIGGGVSKDPLEDIEPPHILRGGTAGLLDGGGA